ncbi:MAG: YkoF family thiamine/hydroxymethylpyrimidine-binding protein [Pseudomonadota bacterium]
MRIAVDISLYPLSEDYLPAIDDVIARINQWPDLDVQTNRLSTQVVGEYDQVMDMLKAEMKPTFEREHQSIFVAKFLRADALGE